jgi:glycosyltransferase involved in cell wall biosynthesis
MEYIRDQHQLKLALIGSYVPRRCGIATFSNDLYNALMGLSPEVQVDVFAVGDGVEHAYPPEVAFTFQSKDKAGHLEAAERIRHGGYDAVLLQHEYGLFGGPAGEDIIDLIRGAGTPVITTMHTVLAQPDDHQRRVTNRLIELSQEIVVMNSRGIELLTRVYNAPEAMIHLIPHGIPDFSKGRRDEIREELGISGPMILTFGLLSPDKGVEFAIDAMPGIVERVPNATYIVLGATHPHIKAQVGEVYREKLIARAAEKGVAGAIQFHDEFVSQERLVDYLSAADIYITPYLNPQQITSGTLAYAVGAGKAVISTPYVYAEELLSDDRGVLVPFRDSEAISQAVTGLIEDRDWSDRVRTRAFEFGQDMAWPKVAESYADLVEIEAPALPKRPSMRYPEFSLQHLVAMTDDTGLFQHAAYSIPNRLHGYCLDDNARALMLMARLDSWEQPPAELARLERTYLSYVLHCYNEETGHFRNFMSYGREWLEETGSDDSAGRALYALATAACRSSQRSVREVSNRLFNQAVGMLNTMTSPRAWAYGILAAQEYLAIDPRSPGARSLCAAMAQRLYRQYLAAATRDWRWFEDVVSYENAMLSHAMLVAGYDLEIEEMKTAGLDSLEWLTQVQTGYDGVFAPVGCEGFYHRGHVCPRYDQQPLEAWATISACLSAVELTGDTRWSLEATRAFRWFLGDNEAGMPLVDEKTGGCGDGLHPHSVNENQGAESTLAFLFAQQEMMAAGQVLLPARMALLSA